MLPDARGREAEVSPCSREHAAEFWGIRFQSSKISLALHEHRCVKVPQEVTQQRGHLEMNAPPHPKGLSGARPLTRPLSKPSLRVLFCRVRLPLPTLYTLLQGAAVPPAPSPQTSRQEEPVCWPPSAGLR